MLLARVHHLNVLLLCLRGRLLCELLQHLVGKARHGHMRVVRALGARCTSPVEGLVYSESDKLK